MTALIPRIVVAGTSSGSGKTTVASGLIGALRNRGNAVQGFKVGPDFIDPGYHALASGRPGRNLDAFLAGPELIAPLFAHGQAGAEIAVVEGVMGLFDGASGRGELASTAHVAKLLRAPVLLVVDGSSMARSAAAIVHGFATYDPEIQIAGVVLNRVGSQVHEQLLREAIEPLGIPVVGALKRNSDFTAPERHLGLVPVDEREPRAVAALESLARVTAQQLDLDAIVALAQAATTLETVAWSPQPGTAQSDPLGANRSGGRRGPRIAVAGGPAFSFHYTEHAEMLEARGAELVPFDPLSDRSLPVGTQALLLAGGFPEVFGSELAANVTLRDDIAAFAAAGGPVVAECGGLLYLGEALDEHAMCGVLPMRAEMAMRLTLGYREARVASDSPCWRAGEVLRGHEFHYSTAAPASSPEPSWRLVSRGQEKPEGWTTPTLQASYLHVHWAAFPQAATRFVAAAAAFSPSPSIATSGGER